MKDDVVFPVKWEPCSLELDHEIREGKGKQECRGIDPSLGTEVVEVINNLRNLRCIGNIFCDEEGLGSTFKVQECFIGESA